jgi:hypothetical protein
MKFWMQSMGMATMLISDAGALVDVEKFGVAKYIREMRNFC